MTVFDFLEGRMCGEESMKDGHNTYLRRHGEYIDVVFHATTICSFAKVGGFILSSGGYKTKVTKTRINTYLPKGHTLKAVKGVWQLESPTGVQEFFDGMWLPYIE